MEEIREIAPSVISITDGYILSKSVINYMVAHLVTMVLTLMILNQSILTNSHRTLLVGLTTTITSHIRQQAVFHISCLHCPIW